MPCPFPGMDPYIERPELWPDFHDSLITCIRAALQPLLRPRYVALIQERVWNDVRQPLVRIVDPADERRPVTVIEVLSPDNKTPGRGRTSYLKNRQDLLDHGTNVVEIDLLREGEPTVRARPEVLANMGPWTYLVIVTRERPPQQEVYSVRLDGSLPRIRIRLADNDNDVGLDLQPAFSRCWAEGPYPELLRYQGPPPGVMSGEDANWCEQMLRQGGMRG